VNRLDGWYRVAGVSLDCAQSYLVLPLCNFNVARPQRDNVPYLSSLLNARYGVVRYVRYLGVLMFPLSSRVRLFTGKRARHTSLIVRTTKSFLANGSTQIATLQRKFSPSKKRLVSNFEEMRKGKRKKAQKLGHAGNRTLDHSH
jgi:hypothetical protein